jgi:hypothetical protein
MARVPFKEISGVISSPNQGFFAVASYSRHISSPELPDKIEVLWSQPTLVQVTRKASALAKSPGEPGLSIW